MKLAACFILAAAAGCAQEGVVERGAQLFRGNCATPYCHGPEGTDGRAPRLIGHHYNVNAMFKVITWGIPGTGMPEFTSRLKSQELADLVAYVMTLGGTAAASAAAPVAPPRAITPEAREGRALFFDAARSGSCGTCHELEGWGVPVGPDLNTSPAERFSDLRAIATHRVTTARPAGEAPFPALPVERTDTRVRVYDLTAPLPVLRTFAAGKVTVVSGTSWRHEQAARTYSNKELETIAVYLRWNAGH